MAGDSDKNWNRPWTTEEIIENADNWSLAGDAALLNSIKAYAEKLLTKTVNLSDNVDEMLNNLNEASLRLDISQNEFQSLRNTQFIESRVYEDDETLENVTEATKGEERQPTEEEKEQTLKNAILEGLEIMNKYFDKIEVSISDSEDEEEEKSDKNYMLKAKDLYADRLLPLVIGTEEWYKKWHVGLIESSSDSESEKTEIYSESDSENDLPKDLMKGSETSSELDFSSQTSENRPVANSTFNDSTKKPDIFASSDESDTQGSLPVKTPISNKTFAEQLTAKLGNVINEQEDITTQINRRPIQPAQTNKYIGDLFADEPPPLDDLEDTILPKSAQSGLFSGGQGLFDDNEDELFWGQQNQGPKSKPDDEKVHRDETKEENKPPVQNIQRSVTSVPKSSHISKGLFDSEDSSSDDDMFASKRQRVKPPYLQPHKTIPPLFDNEPPELEEPKKTTEESTKKKPVGGVSIFGTTNIFGDQKIDNILKPQQQDMQKNIATGKSETADDKPKKINLFDDDVDAVIPTNDTKAKKIDLFEDVDSTSTVSRDKKFNLFDDDADTTSPKTNTSPKKVSLFDDDVDDISRTEPAAKSQTKKISLFDDDDDLFKDDLFSNVVAKKPNLNLFEDVENDSESFINNNTPKLDLFSDLDNGKVESKVTIGRDNVKSGETEDKVAATDVENNNSINIDTEKENEKIVRDDDVILSKAESADTNRTNENISERKVIGAELRTEEHVSVESSSKVSKGLFEDDDEDDVSAKKTEIFDDLFTKNSVVTPPKMKETSKPDVPQLQVTNPTPQSSNLTKRIQERSPIDLFSSTPPPVDDEWDTKSDNFSDNDDLLPSYRVDDNTGQFSIFDNEPPSLGPNESSGIVRDHNVTRVDTADDSSFYPYASSSRRFSSDIFNEQQSQDSFFVTKNKSESINAHSNLGIIPEDTKTSHLSITPSGRLEDFETSKDDSEATNNSVFLDNTKNQAKKPISLFDDDFDATSDSEDLFSAKSEAPKLPEKRSSLFDNVADVTDKESLRKISIPEKTDQAIEETCNSPEASDSKSKIASITEKLQNEFEKEPPKTPTDSPKKLKHNLNINVNALLPGYPSPKLKELPKSASLDLPKEREHSLNVSTPDVSLRTPDLLTSEKRTGSEKAVSFEDALNNVEVLHSVTKDRAKIPIKRRPSTRRGRQEAIRKSVADFSLGHDKNDDVTQETRPEVVNKPVENAEVSELYKEHFVEKVETVAQKIKDNPEPEEIVKERPTSLFDKEGSDDEELFPNLSEKNRNTKDEMSANSIFDSGDSDNDLFGGAESKKSNRTKRSDIIAKKSLFNDSSSDDDLFAGAVSGDTRKQEPVHKTDKKVQKKSVLRKLENIEADDDPLSSLLK